MKTKCKPTSVRLKESVVKTLKRMAAKTGISQTRIIEAAILEMAQNPPTATVRCRRGSCGNPDAVAVTWIEKNKKVKVPVA
jgi:hypothetical protein